MFIHVAYIIKKERNGEVCDINNNSMTFLLAKHN